MRAWSIATRLLGTMGKCRVPLNASSFSSIIATIGGSRTRTSASEAGPWFTVLDILTTMQTSAILPDVVSCSSSIRVCDASGHWQKALTLFCDMDAPNAVSHSSCGETRWPLALHLLHRMSGQSILHTVISYGSCISSCQKSGQWLMSLRLLVEIPKQKLAANAICFGGVISACEQVGNWQMALLLLQRMGEVQATPNQITYNAAISACSRDGQLTTALQLLAEMTQLRLANVVAYSSCIAACEKGGHWQMALHLLTLEASRSCKTYVMN